MHWNCVTYLSRILFKNIGAIVFGLIAGCLITLLIVPKQTIHWVVKNESVFRDEAYSLDITVANKLSKEIRVLCWIMTTSPNHELKAQHVKDTWGRRCTKLLFMSNSTDSVLGSIGLNLTFKDTHKNVWYKTKLAFEYIHKHYLKDYDWFLKADDDTYVIMENLRYLLHRYSPDHPIYFGFPFQQALRQFEGQYQMYMAGGAGYVISKEALRRLVERGFADEEVCVANKLAPEDVHIGYCLRRLNVSAIDTRDSVGRGTFFPFKPSTHLVPRPEDLDPEFWYTKMALFNLLGRNCCSDHAISFHYIEPADMHVLDYFIYNLHPYGVLKYPQPLNGILTEQEMKKLF